MDIKKEEKIDDCLHERLQGCIVSENLSTDHSEVLKKVFNKFFTRYDEKQVEKCTKSLLEISEVDSILLQQLPRLTTKYQDTISDIRQNAVLLSTYRLPLLTLPAHLETSKEHYCTFQREKDAGFYQNYVEPAAKLENSITTSISKIQDVIEELGMNFDELSDRESFQRIQEAFDANRQSLGLS